MHLSMLIQPPRLAQGILMEEGFVCRIPTLPLAFNVRIPSEKIYILPFVMSELCLKELVFSESDE